MSKFIISGLVGLFLVIASSANAESPKAKLNLQASLIYWRISCDAMIEKEEAKLEERGLVILNYNIDDIMKTSFDVSMKKTRKVTMNVPL